MTHHPAHCPLLRHNRAIETRNSDEQTRRTCTIVPAMIIRRIADEIQCRRRGHRQIVVIDSVAVHIFAELESELMLVMPEALISTMRV
jgi:hypothetical protein